MLRLKGEVAKILWSREVCGRFISWIVGNRKGGNGGRDRRVKP